MYSTRNESQGLTHTWEVCYRWGNPLCSPVVRQTDCRCNTATYLLTVFDTHTKLHFQWLPFELGKKHPYLALKARASRLNRKSSQLGRRLHQPATRGPLRVIYHQAIRNFPGKVLLGPLCQTSGAPTKITLSKTLTRRTHLLASHSVSKWDVSHS